MPRTGSIRYTEPGAGGVAYGGAVFCVGAPLVQSTLFLNNKASGGVGGVGIRGRSPSVAGGNDIYDPKPYAQKVVFSGTVGVPFQQQLPATGESISTYSLTSGVLPSGLSLNDRTGAITGTPTQAVVAQRVTFRVRNSYGDSNDAVATFNIQPESLLNVTTPWVREGDGGTTPSQLVFTLTRSQNLSLTASVELQTIAASTASATAKSDYVPLGKTRVAFAPGQTKQTVAITIVGDATYEDNEWVGLLLGSPVGLALPATVVEGAIVNDDPLPTLSINDISVQEGNRDYVRAIFTVSLSNPSDRPISVGYNTYGSGRGVATGGTATTPNVDYIAVALSTLTFTPGQTLKVIHVYIKGDMDVEGDEVFGVRLSAPVNARIADSMGIGTIQNDDSAPLNSAGYASGGNS